jgi:hypothetical protein
LAQEAAWRAKNPDAPPRPPKKQSKYEKHQSVRNAPTYVPDDAFEEVDEAEFNAEEEELFNNVDEMNDSELESFADSVTEEVRAVSPGGKLRRINEWTVTNPEEMWEQVKAEKQKDMLSKRHAQQSATVDPRTRTRAAVQAMEQHIQTKTDKRSTQQPQRTTTREHARSRSHSNSNSNSRSTSRSNSRSNSNSPTRSRTFNNTSENKR